MNKILLPLLTVILGAFDILRPTIDNGKLPTLNDALHGVMIALIGFFAKQYNVSGGNIDNGLKPK